jgi:hypothetical protein
MLFIKIKNKKYLKNVMHAVMQAEAMINRMLRVLTTYDVVKCAA